MGEAGDDRSGDASGERLTEAGRLGTGRNGALSRWRPLELLGLAAVLASLTRFLVTGYVLHPDSDPMRWFAFARNFGDQFGQVNLAYGFPLVASLAIDLVGPVDAFLVNVPVLVSVAALLFAFGRQHRVGSGRDEDLGGTAGLISVALWIAWNTGDSTMLLRLSNPYRDALSFALVLTSCLALLGALSGRRPLASAAASGLCLALASSVRETSALMGAPFLLAAWAGRRRDPSLPAGRAALCFALGGALGIAPLLVQNAWVSGAAVVPAAMAGKLGGKFTYIPGLGLRYAAETVPEQLAELGRHYGVSGLALIAVGAAEGFRRRNPAVLWLSLPAFAVYFVFYGSYLSMVPRYLSVLDLFAAPLAGAGAAALLGAAVGGFGPRARAWIARGSLVAASLFGVGIAAAALDIEWVRVDAEGPRDTRLTLSDVENLRSRIGTWVPTGAMLVAERPLFALFRNFFDNDVTSLMFRTGNRNVRNPVAAARIAEALAARGSDTYYVSASDGGGERGFSREFLLREFDLRPRGEIAGEAMHLGAFYPGSGTLHVEQVLPWSLRETRSEVEVPGPGRFRLEVDVRRLSKRSREQVALYWEDELLDDAPVDGWNHYAVHTDGPGTAVLRLRSDAPVPALVPARLRPLSEPIVMDLRDRKMLGYAGRLSASFFVDLKPVAPVIDGHGTAEVPVVAPAGAGQVLLIVYALMGEGEDVEAHELALSLEGREIHRDLVGVAGDVHEGWSWYELALPLEPGQVRVANPSLDFAVSAPARLGRPPRLVLVSIEVHRIPLDDPIEIAFGTPSAEPFEAQGFAGPIEDDEVEGALPLRWTTGAARVPVFAAAPGREARLTVEVLGGARPAAAPLPVIGFEWNGQALAGHVRSDRVEFREAGGADGLGRPAQDPARVFERAVFTFDLPAEQVHPVNALSVEATPFVPSDFGVDGDDRELGIMLHRIALEAGGEEGPGAVFAGDGP